MKRIITKEEGWKIYKAAHLTAHEDWTPEFFMLNLIKEKGFTLK